MPADVNFQTRGPRPLRLSDSPALDDLARRAPGALSSAGAEDLLRLGAVTVEWIRGRIDGERAGSCWTAVFNGAEEETLAAVAGLNRIDPLRSTAELLLLADAPATTVAPAMDRILKTAFYHFALHRVELRLPDGSPLLEAVRAAGWNEEGVLRGAAPEDDGFTDAHLFAVLREGFDGYGIAFVPFARGYVHLSGDREAVDAVGLLRPDLPIGPGPLLSAALQQRLCDRSGNVVPPSAARQTAVPPPRLPPEVGKAAAQIAEYVVGERTRFDFRTKANGSLFQQKVWAMLEEIPYGTTLTYEQVAQRLLPDDPAAGRRLTRAVGSACSANPLAIVVPCHRVIGKDNKLVGFSGGLDVKEWLLEHEMFGVG